MMSWLNNGWVIGIATGILSGLLVWWITYQFLTKKEDREYRQKVIGANRDVIYAIRPGIPEAQIPSPEIVIALTNATARRYGIPPSIMYKPAEIVEELIKEIMDSSFISSSQKAKYCAELAPLAALPEPERQTLEDKRFQEERQRKTRDLVVGWSAVFGIVTAVLSALFTLSQSKDASVTLKSVGENAANVFGTLLAVLAFVGLMLLPGIAKYYSKKKNLGSELTATINPKPPE